MTFRRRGGRVRAGLVTAALLVSAAMACGKDGRLAEALAALDHTRPRTVARVALEAYRARNAAALVGLLRPDRRAEVQRQLSEPGAADFLFDEAGWRWRSVTAWDGQLHAVRVEPATRRARVRYGTIDDREAAVVQLRADDQGRWYFEDLVSPPQARYATWGDALP